MATRSNTIENKKGPVFLFLCTSTSNCYCFVESRRVQKIRFRRRRRVVDPLDALRPCHVVVTPDVKYRLRNFHRIPPGWIYPHIRSFLCVNRVGRTT